MPSICATLRLRFPHLEWPELPNTSLHRLDLPKINLHDFQLEYPDFQWPSVPDLFFLLNLLRIAFPELEWPDWSLTEISASELSLPNWGMPDWSLPADLDLSSSFFDT